MSVSGGAPGSEAAAEVRAGEAAAGPTTRAPSLPEPAPRPGRGSWLAAVLTGGAAAALLGASGSATWPVILAGGWVAAVGTVLAVVDARTHRLPDRFVGPGAVVLVVLLLLAAAVTGEWGTLGRAVLAGTASMAGYLLLGLLRAGGLGLGDVKLAGPLGMWLGWWGWSAVMAGALVAFALGGLTATVLLLARRVRREDAIAFGPFMILGAAAATVLALA